MMSTTTLFDEIIINLKWWRSSQRIPLNNLFNDLTELDLTIRKLSDEELSNLFYSDKNMYFSYLSRQVAYGEDLVIILSSVPAYTPKELALGVLKLYSQISNLLRRSAFSYIARVTALQADGLTLEVNLLSSYISSDARWVNEIRNLLPHLFKTLRYHELRYDFCHMFTDNLNYVFSYENHEFYKEETNVAAVSQTFQAYIEQIVIMLETKFSVCLQRDQVSIEIRVLKDPKRKQSQQSFIVLQAWSQITNITDAEKIATEGALKLCAIKAKADNEAYLMSVVMLATPVILAKVQGPHVSKTWLTEAAAHRLAANTIFLVQDIDYHQQNYTTVEADNSLRIITLEPNFVTNVVKLKKAKISVKEILKPFGVQGVRPGSANPVPSSYIIPPTLPLKRTVEIGRSTSGFIITRLKTLMNIMQGSKREFSTKTQPRFRFLRPASKLTKIPKPARIACFDVESVVIEGKLTPYLIGILHNQRYQAFVTSNPQNKEEISRIRQEIVQYIRMNLGGYTVFAHNLFGFDFSFIVQDLVNSLRKEFPETALKDLMTFYQNEYNLLQVIFKSTTGKKIKLIDSLNFFPHMSLTKIAKDFADTTKLVTKIDVYKVTLSQLQCENTLCELIEYNKQDCVALMKSLIKFEEIVTTKFFVSPFRACTISALSYKIFLKKTQNLYEKKIVVPDAYNNAFIRTALRGGRVEVFLHKPVTDFKHIAFLDFTSLYSTVALNNPMPSGFINNHESKTDCTKKLGIYFCKVKTTPTSELQIPFLPVRYGETMIYPVGNWYATYTSVEINKAISLGYEIVIIQGIDFTETTYLFDDFIPDLYRWKQTAEEIKNAGYRATAKLILNASIGKFAQRTERKHTELSQSDQIPVTQNEEDTKRYCQSRKIDNVTELITYYDKKGAVWDSTAPSGNSSAPQITTFVNAIARIYLYEAMQLILESGGVLMYVDTDSLAAHFPSAFDLELFNERLSKILPSRSEITGVNGLGKLLEVYPNQKIIWAYFLMAKHYMIKMTEQTRVIMAGVRQDKDRPEALTNPQLWEDIDTQVIENPNIEKGPTIVSTGGIKKDPHTFEMYERVETTQQVAAGVGSVVKRHRVFDAVTKRYVGTVPASIRMKPGIVVKYEQLLLTNTERIPEHFYQHSIGFVDGVYTYDP